MSTDTRFTTSTDGTKIAYTVTGAGPAVVLVGAALSDRRDHRRLTRRLTERLTVIDYDRRGRGSSDGGGPVDPGREIDDLAAVIGATGSSVVGFGSSSGGVLALRAAARVGTAMRAVIAYEPPLILDASRAPVSEEARSTVARLLEDGRDAAAVRYFYGDVMGIPQAGLLAMRVLPGWSRSVRMASTLAGDLALMAGLQDGTRIPDGFFAGVTQPSLVLTGSRSEPFFHHGARSLATVLPRSQARVLDGLHHGSAVMGAPALAQAIIDVVCDDDADGAPRTRTGPA